MQRSKKLYSTKNDFVFDFDISTNNVRRFLLKLIKNQIEKICIDRFRGEFVEYLSNNDSELKIIFNHVIINLQKSFENIILNVELLNSHTTCFFLRVKRKHINDLIKIARIEEFFILASFSLKHKDFYETLIYSCDLDQHVTLERNVQRILINSYRLNLHTLFVCKYKDENVTIQNIVMTFYRNQLKIMFLIIIIDSLFRSSKTFIFDNQLFARRGCNYYLKASINS